MPKDTMLVRKTTTEEFEPLPFEQLLEEQMTTPQRRLDAISRVPIEDVYLDGTEDIEDVINSNLQNGNLQRKVDAIATPAEEDFDDALVDIQQRWMQ